MQREPRVTVALGAVAAFVAPASEAEAKPQAPRLFCDAYPESPQCNGALVTCETCHTSTDPVAWNSFGGALYGEVQGKDFDAALGPALLAIEDQDSDDDEVSNLDEILLGTNPGNADSLWQPIPEPDGTVPGYQLGEWDPRFAYRRALVLYCGYSPSYEQMEHIRELELEDARAQLHEDLAACLDAPYWRTTGLRELADPKIKPIKAVGADTTVSIQGLKITLADYFWDYRLWRYLMSDDRDVRGLLTVQYHVEEDEMTGALQTVEGTIDRQEPFAIDGGQPLEPEHRAGMLTTQWFLMSNTMFSELPRTTAAQAYRAYLGMDISQHQGIWPVDGEPFDIDDKGVDAPACAQCHSTLDPLAYAFAYYEGIILDLTQETGTFVLDRPQKLMPGWDPDVQVPMLFGQEIASVVQFGKVASESAAFRRALTMTLYEHALGRAPWPDELAEFDALVNSMPEDGYSANRLIHRLVDTAGFGTP